MLLRTVIFALSLISADRIQAPPPEFSDTLLTADATPIKGVSASRNSQSEDTAVFLETSAGQGVCAHPDAVRRCGLAELYRTVTEMEPGQTVWVAVRMELGLPRISLSNARIPAFNGGVFAEITCMLPGSYIVRRYADRELWE